MRQNPLRQIALCTALVFTASAGSVLAAPKEDRAEKGGTPSAQQQHGSQPTQAPQNKQGGGQKGQSPQQSQQGGGHKTSAGSQQYRTSGAPSVDIGGVRITLQSHRDLLYPASSLPPGVAQNVGRGKPLPPGIARKVDSRLSDRLPHYEGYEWQQVGRDLVLVAIATGIVSEILENVLD